MLSEQKQIGLSPVGKRTFIDLVIPSTVKLLTLLPGAAV